MSRTSASIGLAAAVVGLVTAFIGLATQLGTFGDVRIPGLPGRDTSGPIQSSCNAAQVTPNLSLNVGSGPSQTSLTVSGRGFCPNQQVQIRFHTEHIAVAQTDAAGVFSVPATVPGTFDAFAPQQFTITAGGRAGQTTVPFQLTAR